MEVTKESKTVLYELYNQYQIRRHCGTSKRKAISFGSAQDIQNSFFPDMNIEDLEDALCELGRNELLNNEYADNTVWSCYLTDKAIVAIENLPAAALTSVIKFISAFI